ncbi:MAG: flippase-like domain-containing protein [Fervidicoccaceae archaeon]
MKLNPWLLVAVSLLIVAAIYAAYLEILEINILQAMRNNLLGIFISAAFMLVAEIVKSIRSLIIFRKIGYRVKFKNILISRFVGNFMGIVTPSSFASEPGRVMSLAMLEGTPMEGIMAAGVLETFYDSTLIAIVAAGFSLYKLPSSILILLSSFFILGLWTFIFAGFVFRDSIFRRVFSYLERRMGDRIVGASRKILSRYAEFAEFTKSGLDPEISISSFLITILTLLLYSASFLSFTSDSSGMLLQLIHGAIAYSSSYTMQVFPTPGGSGFFEYALSLSLSAYTSALWRITYLMVNLIPAGLILIFFVKIRSVISENIKKSIFS